MREERRLPTADEIYAVDLQVRDAVRLAYSGKPAEAAARLEATLETVPDHAFGRLHLALALAGDGRYEEALPHLRKALDLAPEKPAFHLFAGRVHFDAGAHEAARTAFERAAELSPDNDLVLGYRILNEWAAGDREAAFRLPPDALPESSLFLARLLFLIESELCGRMVEYEASAASARFLDRMRIAYWLWRGAAQRKRGRLLNAMAMMDMVLEVSPGHAAAARFQRECREAALQTAQRQVEEAPASVAARLELATLLAEADEYVSADEQMRTADRIAGEKGGEEDMDSPEVSRLRARIAYGLGGFEEALEFAEAGKQPGFSMMGTHYMLGLCRMSLYQRRLSLIAFQCLVEKVCWAVPLRLREYRAWRRSAGCPDSLCESET